jgi:hypothetical protein
MKKLKERNYELSYRARICPVCGKEFIPAAMHVYKDRRPNHRFVCSWSCVCESERLKEANRKRAGKEWITK